MFQKYIEKKRRERFANMERQLPSLPDQELKGWYSQCDTNRITGQDCKYERKLLSAIENELVARGFEYQTDF